MLNSQYYNQYHNQYHSQYDSNSPELFYSGQPPYDRDRTTGKLYCQKVNLKLFKMQIIFYLRNRLRAIIWWQQLKRFMQKDSQHDQNSLRLFKKFNWKIAKKKMKNDLPRNKGPEIDCQIWVARRSSLVRQFVRSQYCLQSESNGWISSQSILPACGDTLLYFIRLYKLLTIYN